MQNQNSDIVELKNDNEIVIETNIVKHKQNNTIKFLYSLFIIFAVLFIFSTFFGRIVFFPIQVQGVSMQPTLNYNSSTTNEQGDIVYLGSCRNVSYHDIVVFDSGSVVNGKSQIYIKRVIALPGDTIQFKITEIKNDYVYYDLYINGILQNEEYILEPMRIYIFTQNEDELAFFINSLEKNNPITLKENEYYLLGDNRNNSLDSRFIGPINKSSFIGKVYLHIPYGKTVFQALIEKIF